MGRRTNETQEDKKVYKQWYDLFIRASRSEDEYWFNVFRGAFNFHMDYAANPEKYRDQRRAKQAAHNEYCRQPEYKEYKKSYDQGYRAKKDYGEFGEAAIVLSELEKEIDVRLAKRQNGIINKSQKRKRLWQKIQAKQSLNSLLEI
jgi:hypothetical protein